MSNPAPASPFIAPEVSELTPFFPGYDIELLIATGGMGAVYRAVQKSLDRDVAIKILPYEFSADPSFCERFSAEAKAMAKLNHVNLIGVYDFGEANGMLYIIMELVPGKSLFHSANGIAIDPTEVIRIVSGICNGLSHAHEHGILHRDIKPSNILLDINAQPKIGDFGLARSVDVQIKEDEEIFGTPHYTAPEVITPPYHVDHRADIFSVGVMLHELLTGRLPADDPRTASQIIRCHPRFDAIIQKATHPNPQNRYPSAADISRELNAIVTSGDMEPQKHTAQHNLKNTLRFKLRPAATPSSSLKHTSPIHLRHTPNAPHSPSAPHKTSRQTKHAAPRPAKGAPASHPIARRPPATAYYSAKPKSSNMTGILLVILILLMGALIAMILSNKETIRKKLDTSLPSSAIPHASNSRTSSDSDNAVPDSGEDTGPNGQTEETLKAKHKKKQGTLMLKPSLPAIPN